MGLENRKAYQVKRAVQESDGWDNFTIEKGDTQCPSMPNMTLRSPFCLRIIPMGSSPILGDEPRVWAPRPRHEKPHIAPLSTYSSMHRRNCDPRYLVVDQLITVGVPGNCACPRREVATLKVETPTQPSATRPVGLEI